METSGNINMVNLEDYREQIDSALAYSGGTHDFDDVARGVISAKMQLWPARNSCAITEIICYPKKKVLHVFLAAGDKQELVGMIESAEAWGKTQGCESITMSGRHGWLRVLGKEGWKSVLTVMEKSI
jgi:hypothetical protein